MDKKIDEQFAKEVKEIREKIGYYPDNSDDSTQEAYDQPNIRDECYTILLKEFSDNYKKAHKTKRNFKCFFFYLVCASFVGVLVAGFHVIICISMKDGIDFADAAVAIAGLGSIISAIVVLPKIIAKHLFPKEGDEKDILLVSEMLKFDSDPEEIKKRNKEWNPDFLE